MAFRFRMQTGEGWLPPDARLVRDSGQIVFIPPRGRTEREAAAYADGWFQRHFAPAMYAMAFGRRSDLDPDIDSDLIEELDRRPEGTWLAYGVAYKSPPDPLLTENLEPDRW